MAKQVANLDYFSFAKRDDDGHHWDLSDGKKRIATIRGGLGQLYIVCYNDGKGERIFQTHTLKGAMRHLLVRFVNLQPGFEPTPTTEV